jgi:hypothetical protein
VLLGVGCAKPWPKILPVQTRQVSKPAKVVMNSNVKKWKNEQANRGCDKQSPHFSVSAPVPVVKVDENAIQAKFQQAENQ